MNKFKGLLVERVQGSHLPRNLKAKYKSMREAHNIQEVHLDAPITSLYQ